MGFALGGFCHFERPQKWLARNLNHIIELWADLQSEMAKKNQT
jgi:hypothetical protein